MLAAVHRISDCIWDGFEPSVLQSAKRQHIGNQIRAAHIVAQSDFVNVFRVSRFLIVCASTETGPHRLVRSANPAADPSYMLATGCAAKVPKIAETLMPAKARVMRKNDCSRSVRA